MYTLNRPTHQLTKFIIASGNDNIIPFSQFNHSCACSDIIHN